MNSSAQPLRRIASNLLWRDGEVLRDPLVELTASGRIVSARSCPAPDREPFTEFYPGVIVADFPAEGQAVFRRLLAAGDLPLGEALAAAGYPDPEGAAVVVSGLDYATMRLTPRLRILSLASPDAVCEKNRAEEL